MKKLIVIVAMLALCGCQEQQQWGQGDPDEVWQGYFGNSNIARLDFVQTNRINSHGQLIAEMVNRVARLEARPVHEHEIIVFDPNDIENGMLSVPCKGTQ